MSPSDSSCSIAHASVHAACYVFLCQKFCRASTPAIAFLHDVDTSDVQGGLFKSFGRRSGNTGRRGSYLGFPELSVLGCSLLAARESVEEMKNEAPRGRHCKHST